MVACATACQLKLADDIATSVAVFAGEIKTGFTPVVARKKAFMVALAAGVKVISSLSYCFEQIYSAEPVISGK